MFKRLLKLHATEWACKDGWGGVGDKNLARFCHRVTQGQAVGGGGRVEKGVNEGKRG